ncbi:hypothetical protein CDL15_Pgr011292 [Punica granatum]|uniref:Uncharacterized protein n=1 Tax=Punica granatum TaxID=22663 RepID=A0A218WEB8_PUNGR|nr:hypothetical protein CDL15_Pgr011292 [Punica granatum]
MHKEVTPFIQLGGHIWEGPWNLPLIQEEANRQNIAFEQAVQGVTQHSGAAAVKGVLSKHGDSAWQIYKAEGVLGGRGWEVKR